MNNLFYLFHLFLNTKYTLLLNLIISILIVFIYNILLYDFTFVECMNQNTDNSPQITPSNPYEHIRILENENNRLNEYVNVLIRELRYNIEQRFVERNSYDSAIQSAAMEIRELRQHLQNSSQTIAETNQLVNRLMQENDILRGMIDRSQQDYTTGLDSTSDNT